MCELKEIFDESLGATQLEKTGLSILKESQGARKALQQVCTFMEKGIKLLQRVVLIKIEQIMEMENNLAFINLMIKSSIIGSIKK